MKKIITLITLAGLFVHIIPAYSQTENANFIAGNLVVIRVNTNTTNNAVPVFLDEYNVAGTLINTVPMPTETVGANRRFLVGGGVTGSSQGFGNLSPNGQYLAIAGHDVAAGAAQSTAEGAIQHSATPKVIAVISNGVSSPVINTTTAVIVDNRDNRTAVIDNNGQDIWFGGQLLGIHYTTLGSTTSTQVSASPGATRHGGIGIFNGQLYQSTNTNPYRVAKIGDGLPTTSATATALAGIPATGSNIPAEDVTNGFILFDVDAAIPGNDLLYFVSELNNATDGLGAGHLRKYVRTTESGDDWVFAGGVSVSNTNSIAKVSANSLVAGLRSLTGTLVGGVPTLYAASSNRIIKVVDNAPYKSDLNTTISSVATAATGTGFRGLTFAPGTEAITTLPVTLTSFTGKAEQNFVKLNWITSSEQNNSHFEVLRSADGKSFNVIGNVKGNNNSDIAINYEFKDQNPLNVTAYYRLNQVDYDGKNKLSSVISVEPGLAVLEEFTVYTSAQSVVVRFNSALKSNGKIVIYNAEGQAIINKDIVIETGANEVILPAKGIKDGNIYVALLNAEGKIQSEKFIANNQ